MDTNSGVLCLELALEQLADVSKVDERPKVDETEEARDEYDVLGRHWPQYRSGPILPALF